MTKKELEIIKDGIIDEVTYAIEAHKDIVDTTIEVDENNEDTLYAVFRAKFTYDGHYDDDVDYYETTSVHGTLVELSLFENNESITTPNDFLCEIERVIA